MVGPKLHVAPTGASVAVLRSEKPEAAHAGGGSHTLDEKDPSR